MARKKPPEIAETLSPCVEAKDEMNLAEFPLSLLTDRPDTDRASLVYEDTTYDSGSNRTITRKLIITAPAKHGLPRGIDAFPPPARAPGLAWPPRSTACPVAPTRT